MKKSLCVILVLMLTMTGLYTLSALAESVVEIDVMAWGFPAEKVAREGQAALFNQTHPGIKVNMLVTPDYDRKLDTLIAANDAPDVYETSDDWYNIRGMKGQLLDLRPFIERDGVDLSLFVQRSIESYTLDSGMIEALPLCLDPFVMAYNKDLFDAAGLAYPQAGWTWDDCLAIAQKLTDNGEGAEKVYGINDLWMFQQISAFFYGGSYMNEDYTKCLAGEDLAVQGMQFYVDLSKKYGVMPNTDATAAMPGFARFYAGKTAMSPMNMWDMFTFEESIGDNFKWDLVPMPATKELGHLVTWYISPGWGIWSGSDKQEAAWEFVKWCTTDPGALAIASTAGVPAYKSTEAINSFLNQDLKPQPLNLQSFIDSMDFARVGPYGGIYAEISDEFSRAWEDIMLNNTPVKEAMSYFAEQCDTILARIR
jgi:multiple sugar transport system substrate-binding protein